jgi:hypothetical protein
MKFKAPAGCTSVSVSGETFNADADGIFTLPDDGNYVGLLAPHGFTQVAQTAKPAADPAPAETAKPAAKRG